MDVSGLGRLLGRQLLWRTDRLFIGGMGSLCREVCGLMTGGMLGLHGIWPSGIRMAGHSERSRRGLWRGRGLWLMVL